jgi:hypothetical protein
MCFVSELNVVSGASAYEMPLKSELNLLCDLLY